MKKRHELFTPSDKRTERWRWRWSVGDTKKETDGWIDEDCIVLAVTMTETLSDPHEILDRTQLAIIY